MRTTFTCLLLLCFVGIAGYSYAQDKPTELKGLIFNEAYVAAEAATVTLLRYRDSLYIKGTTSNKNGLFDFSNLKPDTYLLQITKTGYHKAYAGPYKVGLNKTVVTDSIKLRLAEVNLKEVQVTEKRKYYEVGPDKTVLNVDRSILATGSSALTILSTAPGVKVNNDGEVTMRGNLSASIFVNGKQIKLEGDDLASYLQNLQAANIDQVELIHNPSAKFDAAGSGGVINIILKKGKNDGFNGNVTANADYGKYGKAGTTFSGNYRSKKIDVFGNAAYKYVETDRTINYLRNIASTNYTTIDTRYHNTQRTPTLTYGLGADYFISPKHTIGFLIKGTAETSRFDKQTKTNLYNNFALDTESTTLSNLKRSRDLISYNLNYAGTLGHTKQTLSADADVSILNRNAEEDIKSSADAARKGPLSSAPIPVFNTTALHNQAPTRYVNESVKVDYGNPLTKTLRLDAGLKFSYIKNDNNQEFTMLKDGTYQPVLALTSQFNYTERNFAAYMNTNGSSGKFSYNAGLRFENIVSSANTLSEKYDLKRNYNNLYPSVQLNYQLKESQLTFDYNRRTSLPAYDNLNPIISYQDNYTYRLGNAYLRPDYTNKFQLTYTGKTKYQVALFTSLTSDFFNYSYFSQDDATRVLKITRMNLKRMNYYGVNFNIPIQFTKWWDGNLNAEGSYYQFKDYQGFLNKWSKDIILNLDQNFAISKTLSATLHAEYESGVFYGIYYNKPVYSVAPGISKQLFNNTASINLTVFDIFNTMRGKINVEYKDLDITTYDKAETQIAHLSFVYKFGKRTVKGARKHVAGNSDEQKRMSGSN